MVGEEIKPALQIIASEQADGLAEELVAAYCLQRPDIRCRVTLAAEEAAFALVINKRASLAITGREIFPFEAVPWKKLLGTPPFAIPIALSPSQAEPARSLSVAVYVHHTNPLQKLTLAQLGSIFTQGNPQGDYSRWGQMGLSGEWAERGLHPLLLPETSPIGGYLQRSHFCGRERSYHSEYVAQTDALMARLAQDPCAIGIAELGRESGMLRRVPLVADNGEEAWYGSTAEMQQQKYPLTRYLWLSLPLDQSAKLEADAAAFARFILSAAGQEIVGRHPRFASPGDTVLQQHSARLATHL